MVLSLGDILKHFNMLIKITPDKERARSLFNSMLRDEEFLATLDVKKFAAIAAQFYYETARQLATAILYLDGYKTIGEYAHKETISYLRKYPDSISEAEILLFDDLRNKRNKQSYEGKPIEQTYLENNRRRLIELIEKLKNIVSRKLEEKPLQDQEKRQEKQ